MWINTSSAWKLPHAFGFQLPKYLQGYGAPWTDNRAGSSFSTPLSPTLTLNPEAEVEKPSAAPQLGSRKGQWLRTALSGFHFGLGNRVKECCEAPLALTRTFVPGCFGTVAKATDKVSGVRRAFKTVSKVKQAQMSKKDPTRASTLHALLAQQRVWRFVSYSRASGIGRRPR